MEPDFLQTLIDALESERSKSLYFVGVAVAPVLLTMPLLDKLKAYRWQIGVCAFILMSSMVSAFVAWTIGAGFSAKQSEAWMQLVASKAHGSIEPDADVVAALGHQVVAFSYDEARVRSIASYYLNYDSAWLSSHPEMFIGIGLTIVSYFLWVLLAASIVAERFKAANSRAKKTS